MYFNFQVWHNISKQISSHDARQCENKFKCLKAKYSKKIDNMSSKSSDAGAVSFEYFDEFDQIFGKQPIVTPVIACSSRQNQINNVIETGN